MKLVEKGKKGKKKPIMVKTKITQDLLVPGPKEKK